MRLASFDVGVFNTGVYIEEFDEEKIKDIKNIPKNKRYLSSGEPSKEFQTILDKIFLNGICIYIGKINFLDERKKVLYINNDMLCNITRSIMNMDILSTCDAIIIEKQLDINKKAKRIENHIQSVLSIKIPNVEVIIYNASNKTQVLGAPKKVKNKKGKIQNMTKPMRKKWACELTKYIVTLRRDLDFYEYLFVKNKKPDDECDCICQLQSAKYKIFCEKTLKLKQNNVYHEIVNQKQKEVIEIIKKRKCEIVNENSSPMFLKCFYNHYFWITYIDILNGDWCKECMKNYKKIIFKDNVFFDSVSEESILKFYKGSREKIYVDKKHPYEENGIKYIPNHMPIKDLTSDVDESLSFFIDEKLEDIKEISLKHGCLCLSKKIINNELLFLCSHDLLFLKKLNKINKRCRKFCECK